jgi:high-affinity nickel permease
VLFLFAIPIINIVVLAGVYRLLGRVRRGENYTEEDLNDFLARRGLFGGLFRTLSG